MMKLQYDENGRAKLGDLKRAVEEHLDAMAPTARYTIRDFTALIGYKGACNTPVVDAIARYGHFQPGTVEVKKADRTLVITKL